jgi:hypothetical protein
MLRSSSGTLIRPSATFSRHREKGLDGMVFAMLRPSSGTLIRPSATFSRSTREKGLD